MAKRRQSSQEQRPIRKSFLVVAGAVLGAAVLGLALMNFVGGEEISTPPSGPSTAAPDAAGTNGTRPGADEPGPGEIRPGGRDPFQPAIAMQQPAQNEAAAAPAPEPEAPAPAGANPILFEVFSADGQLANIAVNGALLEGAKPGTQLAEGYVLEAVQGECVFVARTPERFRVCAGERYLK